ncbi:MAG: nitroreductase family deazaflavin-dependent oxidoreductase [Acidimicrobiia bacterium]
MAKEYHPTKGVNRIMTWMARRGIGKSEVLTTTGHKSGQPRHVPVSPLVEDGTEYVVSPYGEVAWVHNVRANPTVTMRHGSKVRSVRLEEMADGSGAPVVAAYHARESFARPFMDVPENPTVDDFAERAAQFPVFRVTETR